MRFEYLLFLWFLTKLCMEDLVGRGIEEETNCFVFALQKSKTEFGARNGDPAGDG